jgi:hypothetical protein
MRLDGNTSMMLNGNTIVKNSSQRAAVLVTGFMTLLCRRVSRLNSFSMLATFCRIRSANKPPPPFDLGLLPSLSSTVSLTGAS